MLLLAAGRRGSLSGYRDASLTPARLDLFNAEDQGEARLAAIADAYWMACTEHPLSALQPHLQAGASLSARTAVEPGVIDEIVGPALVPG